MEYLKVKWIYATKVCWSILWRLWLFSFCGGSAVAGAVHVSLKYIVSSENIPLPLISGGIGWFVGLVLFVWVIKNVLELKYSDFSITLIPITKIIDTQNESQTKDT